MNAASWIVNQYFFFVNWGIHIMLAGPRYNTVSILWWHISPPKSLLNLHPKLQSVLFQKEKPIILQIYFSTKKTKKTTTTPKKYKVWFLNSQSMDFKIETYNSSKLLLYKREKKDKCAKYVFWKYKVWFLNYKLYFLKIKVRGAQGISAARN